MYPAGRSGELANIPRSRCSGTFWLVLWLGLALQTFRTEAGSSASTNTAGVNKHWAFEPPSRPAPPAVNRSDWSKNPIDLFVLVRLEAEHLSPSPEADRRTLIRRLYMVMLGMPPTPEEVTAFVTDPRKDAFEYLA